MVDDSNPTLNLPPFPPLRWRHLFWSGRIVLSSWAGFQSRLGAYAGTSPNSVPDGTIRLRIAPPGNAPQAKPNPEQVAAYEELLMDQDAVRDKLVAAIFEEYPRIRRNILGDGIVNRAKLPELGAPDDLQPLIGLAVVHVLRVAKDGVAYVGFEFGCSWDEEHGLGIMMHQGRIVEFPENGVGKVNGADLASEEWLAEEDANAVE